MPHPDAFFMARPARPFLASIPCAKRSGVVMVLTLVAVVLLASLVFFVLNLGRQTNARVVTQNSADASAAAGAGWVARSLNTVAMNNVGMSHLIASVNILDGMPEAVHHTFDEQQSLATLIQEQLDRGVNGTWVRDGLNRMLAQVNTELSYLQPMDQYLNRSGMDIRELTFYEGPAGRGQLWTAMQSMDEYSQAAMENLGPLAQLNAIRGGIINLQADESSSGNDSAAMLLPLVPSVPWHRGQFDDFQRPVTKGLLPTAIDNKTTNRGPYDVLFGWRDLVGGTTDGYYVDGDSSLVQSGRGNVPIGSSAGGDANRRFVVTNRQAPDRYVTYGPLRWTLQRINNFNDSQMYYSRLADRVSQHSNIKIGYLWPQEASYYPPHRALPLRVRGYRNAVDRAANMPAWDILLVKDYRFWFDGPAMLRTNPPSNYFYLEDGVNTTSNDLVLRVEDKGDGLTEVTYISQATIYWIYDVLAADGTIVLQGLGQGINGRKTGWYSAQVPTPPNRVLAPQWITDYIQAIDIADADMQLPPAQRRILETRFIAIEIKSRYPASDSRFLSPGSWAYDYSKDRYNPRLVYNQDWVDPREWGVPQVTPYIWRDEWTYEAYFDSTIGLSPQLDPDGNQVAQVVYRIDDFVFAGINVGNYVDVRNPYNFPSRDVLPAPIDLNHALVSISPTDRRKNLTYLSIARRNDRALLWPTKFAGKKPTPYIVALAQAQVFNNHSWDLWTQMWSAQIEPVQQYANWVTTFHDGMESDSSTPGTPGPPEIPSLSAQDLTEMHTYLRNTQALSDIMLTH